MDKQNLFLETPQDHFANYEKLLEQVSNFYSPYLNFPILTPLVPKNIYIGNSISVSGV
jgi:hypothetical protein